MALEGTNHKSEIRNPKSENLNTDEDRGRVGAVFEKWKWEVAVLADGE